MEHEGDSETAVPMQYREVTSEQLVALQKLAVERIEFWARIDRLVEHSKLLPILYAWKNWGSNEDCKRYIQKVSLQDVGLLAFLRAVFQDQIDQAMKNYQKNKSWDEALNTLSDFAAPKWLEPHAKAMFEDLAFEQLREQDQLALMIFLDLMKTETSKNIPKTV